MITFTPEPCPECHAVTPCDHYTPVETWPLSVLTPQDRKTWA